jgi:hypothetical protein
MTLGNSIPPSELQRQFDLAYNNKVAHVILCLAEDSDYSSDTSISDWELLEIQSGDYSRQSAVIQAKGLNEDGSAYSSKAIGVTFTSLTESYYYDSIVAFIDGEQYPFFVSRLSETKTIGPGESEGINFEVSVFIDTPSDSQVDQYYNNVIILLHFNGEDGSTVFHDSGPLMISAEKITPYLSASISTAQSRFSGSSLFFGRNDGCVELDIMDELASMGSVFTIEFFVFALSTSNDTHIFSMYDTDNQRGGILIGVNDDYRVYATISADGGSTFRNIISSDSILNAGWKHVALTRDGSVFYLHVDGKGSSTFYPVTIDYPDSMIPCLGMATATTTNDFHGFIDEFRITKDVARYKADYITVPTLPFPDS